MSTYYIVPTSDKSLSSVKSTVLATGVAFLFVYLVPLPPLSATTSSTSWSPSWSTWRTRNATTPKRSCWRHPECSTSTLSAVLPPNPAMVSIYPPFYYGPQSAIMSWITLIIVILLHVFCIYGTACKGRSAWSILYLLYHLCIAIWIFMVLVVGYTWSNQQPAAWDE